MSSENLSESSNLAIEPPAALSSKPKSKNPMIWVQSITFVLGLSLLFYLIYKTGFKTIGEIVSRIGWGFLVVVALNGLRHAVRAFCIYLIISKENPSVKYINALAARLGGEAVSVVTFTGPFLGDMTKAALLKRDATLSHSAATIIVDNIIYYASVVLMILCGVGALFYTIGGEDRVLRYTLIGIAVFALAFFVMMAVAVTKQVKPMSWVVSRLINRNWLPGFIARRKDPIFDIEETVYQFYNERRAAFFALFGLIVFSHALSVVEVFYVMELLGFEPTVLTAFIIESLNKVINSAFSFVPGTVGVYEGGNGIILKIFGYTTATGVALALVRRGAIFFWTFVGLLILLGRTITRGAKQQENEEDES